MDEATRRRKAHELLDAVMDAEVEHTLFVVRDMSADDLAWVIARCVELVIAGRIIGVAKVARGRAKNAGSN